MPSKPLKAIRPMFPRASSWRIVRGDLVQVMVGKDKGKQGEVMRVIRDQRIPRVFVQGINMITRRIPKTRDQQGTARPGFTVRMEAPIHYSNVMLVDPQSKKPVRTVFMFENTAEGKRVRFTKGRNATNCVVPWPEKWKEDRHVVTLVGDKDTQPQVADEVTYDPANDFNLVLPSAHRRLRELRELRDTETAKKAAAKKQQWREQRQLLFRSQAAAMGNAGADGSAPGGSRGYSSSSSSSSVSPPEAGSSSSSSSSSSVQQRPGLHLALLQSRSSLAAVSRRSCWGISGSRWMQLQWCGLAAAPCLV